MNRLNGTAEYLFHLAEKINQRITPAARDIESTARYAFGLGRKHPARTLINPKVLWRWFVRGDIFRYGIGRIETDGHQMPGVFLLRDGKIVRSFRHRNISDQPDYLKLIA